MDHDLPLSRRDFIRVGTAGAGLLLGNTLPSWGDKTIDLLKKNLEELGVEQVDLTYTHSIGHAVYDLDALVANNGPMAALEKAKKEGLTRFVGITGHNRPEKFAEVLTRRDIEV